MIDARGVVNSIREVQENLAHSSAVLSAMWLPKITEKQFDESIVKGQLTDHVELVAGRKGVLTVIDGVRIGFDKRIPYGRALFVITGGKRNGKTTCRTS